MEIRGGFARPVRLEDLLDQYRQWLREERGLAPESVRCYVQQSRKLLASLSEPVGRSLGALEPADIISYVVAACQGSGSRWSAKAHVTALRSFLRFLHVSGLTSSDLAPAVLGIVGWRLSQVPRGLPRDQVDALLDCHDTTTVTGIRDKAVLGLRGAESV